MRMVYTYTVRLFLIAFLLLSLCGKSYSQSNGSFTDTLQVFIADSSVVQDGAATRLDFTVYVKRSNANWNNGDSIMGMADLCFNYSPNAFKIDDATGNLTTTLLEVNQHLYAKLTSGVEQGKKCKVDLQVGTLAGLLHIGLTPRNLKEARPDLTDSLVLPTGDSVFICRIGVELKIDPAYPDAQPAHLGLQWDLPATGLMTIGGNPIIDKLKGDVLVNPTPNLNIHFLTESPLIVCEGEVAELAVKGESTGNQLRYIWQDSKNINGPWHSIDTANAPKLGRVHTAPGYSYDLLGEGDTMRIYRTPGNIDSIYFRCVAEDLSLPLGVKQKISEELQLILRDSIYGFLSHENNTLLVDQVDTVRKCPETRSVAVRFNVTGLTAREFTALDSVFFAYYWEKDPGNIRRETIGFAVTNDNANPNKPVDGGDIKGFQVYAWKSQLSAVGTYYLENIWSKSKQTKEITCRNGAPLVRYDTLYLKEDTNQMLMPKSILVDGTMDVDVAGQLEFTGKPTTIMNTNSTLGTVTYFSQWPSTYKAKKIPGLDTMRYNFSTEGVTTCYALREMEVIDKKYLALKVLLEGPYKGQKDGVDNMPSLSTVFPTIAVPGSTRFVSPYDANCSVAMSTVTGFPGGKKISDWIHIKLREVTGTQTAGDVAYSISAFLREDGVICDTSGVPYLLITRKNATEIPATSYFVQVEHRNHLAIMSAKPIKLFTTIPNAMPNEGDLTVLSNVYDIRPGVGNAPLLSKSGQNCMILGDSNGDGMVTIKDLSDAISANTSLNYQWSDVNFDKIVTVSDISLFTSRLSYMKKFKSNR